MTIVRAFCMVLLFASAAAAQSEDQLRLAFEGKTVTVKLEMPGSDDGVDVYPARTQPIDFPKHAARLKQFGTAIKRGEQVLVTKVKVKKDLIEFQLGGGGYGTLFDDASSDVHVPSAEKTQREKNLDEEIKKTTDAAQRRKLTEERDALKKEREREDARNRAQAAQAQQLKEANIRQRRLEGGSRFNVRYDHAVPSEALTPDGLRSALAEYVEFAGAATPAVASAPALSPEKAAGGPDELRKGLTPDQVDALLGRPESINQRKEGTLSVSTSTYASGDRVIVAEFVEGVLIRYTIRSR